MKTHMFIITCFVLSFPFLLNAQTNIEDGLLSPKGYVEVVDVPLAAKDELYNRAKIWFAKSFFSSNDVIQLDDKENGLLIGKANIPYSAPGYTVGTNYSGVFRFTLTIEVRDNRYRFKIEDLAHHGNRNGYSGGYIANEYPDWGRPRSTWPKVQEKAINEIKLVILSLKNSMGKSEEKDNW